MTTNLQAAETKAQESLKELTSSLRKVDKHPSEVEAIHRLRVSIRRFKQVLRVFEDEFEHVRRMRRSLRGIMDLCGEVRNWDIALEVLAAAGIPARPGLEKRLKRHRTRTARDLAKLLKHSNLRKHTRQWRQWLEAREGNHPPPDLITPLARGFHSAGNAAAKAGAPYAQMHRFRLLVKRYRYTLEILAPVEARLEVLRVLQDHLGAINDCVTTSELIGDIKMPIGELRKIRAALNRLLEKRSAEFRAYWNTHARHNKVQGSVR